MGEKYTESDNGKLPWRRVRKNGGPGGLKGGTAGSHESMESGRRHSSGPLEERRKGSTMGIRKGEEKKIQTRVH